MAILIICLFIGAGLSVFISSQKKPLKSMLQRSPDWRPLKNDDNEKVRQVYENKAFLFDNDDDNQLTERFSF